jgi:hypothetical protein
MDTKMNLDPKVFAGREKMPKLATRYQDVFMRRLVDVF